MLPLLPALILLLLKGPSNIERLAIEGRLPAALEAMHRQMAQPGAEKLSQREEEALATLIAVGTNAELTRVLISLLWNSDDKPTVEPKTTEDPSKPVLGCADSPPPADGFSLCRRSRDGPSIIGAAI